MEWATCSRVPLGGGGGGAFSALMDRFAPPITAKVSLPLLKMSSTTVLLISL